jgi:hypothetical protein
MAQTKALKYSRARPSGRALQLALKMGVSAARNFIFCPKYKISKAGFACLSKKVTSLVTNE